MYENVTTAYPVNLPVNVYQDYIKRDQPDAKKEWFIRPHHVENLTDHSKSLKDDATLLGISEPKSAPNEPPAIMTP